MTHYCFRVDEATKREIESLPFAHGITPEVLIVLAIRRFLTLDDLRLPWHWQLPGDVF